MSGFGGLGRCPGYELRSELATAGAVASNDRRAIAGVSRGRSTESNEREGARMACMTQQTSIVTGAVRQASCIPVRMSSWG